MRTFTVADPTTFDGNPYEVAERAVAQAGAIAEVLETCLSQAENMARNAQMSRNLIETPNDARGQDWEREAQAKVFQRLQLSTQEAVTKLAALRRAVGYDPKHPPTNA